MSFLPQFSVPILTSLSIGYLALCGFFHVRQTRMIFLPEAAIETTPTMLGLPHEELWIPVDSTPNTAGSATAEPIERIHGWWIPAKDDNAKVLLYLHGNGINIGANVDHAHRFHQLGFSVLLMDYRGYGQSEGQFPHETQVYEDAEIMWNYLTQERQIPPQQIVLYGHSLGGAIAIELATRHPNCAGLIVDGTFTSMRDMASLNPFFNLFPIDWILTQEFDSISKVADLHVPKLFIHGTADDRVPAYMSEELYQTAAAPKQLYLVPSAGHNNVAETAGLRYLQVVQQFIQPANPTPTQRVEL